MLVLVTGGAGFIGSHTVDLLIEKGYKVRVLDNLEPQVHGNAPPKYINKDAEYVFGDVTKKEDLLKSLRGVDAVMHLAAMVGVGQSMYQPTRYLTVNSIGTSNFYEILINKPEIRNNIQKIIVASSKSIYGEGAYKCKVHGVVYPGLRPKNQLVAKDWELRCPICNEHISPVGITEDKPAQNLSIYALSKYDTEKIAMTYAHALNINTTVLRYFNVYGPRQSLNNPYTGICAIFMSRAKNNKPPTIFEDGNQIRDFIYVEDVAMANLLALEKDTSSDVFNVGTGKTETILNAALTIVNILGSTAQPEVTNNFRLGDNRHDYADISKIKEKLGFVPKWDIKKGFEKLVSWGESEEAVDKFEESEKERKNFLGV